MGVEGSNVQPNVTGDALDDTMSVAQVSKNKSLTSKSLKPFVTGAM